MTPLELRSLSSPDADPDDWLPDDNRVLILLQLEVGVVGQLGADTFNVVVATPEGLSSLAQDDELGALAHRATIVVREFTWKKVRTVLEGILRQCVAPTWSESVLKLQRYFQWEYEDFVRG